ncbi:MAG: RhuM family protein [Sphingomonas sp.]
MTSHTPADILQSRADANQPNMGLTSWPHDNIRKSDVIVSKNYFGASEVKELNRLTTILLDIFEDQTDLGRLVMMDDARRILDQQLQSLGRVLLPMGEAFPPPTQSDRPRNSMRFTVRIEKPSGWLRRIKRSPR